MKLIPNFLLKVFQKKGNPAKYETILQNAHIMSKDQKEAIKLCKRILMDNKVPLDKIKFVFESSFIYDLDKNIINPIYKQLIPKNKKSHVIEIGKSHNTMVIYLGQHMTVDNYAYLKETLKKSKRGVVVLIDVIGYDDILWMANLDDAIMFYYSTFDCES